MGGEGEGRLGHQRLPGRRIKAMVRLGLETDIPLVLHPMSREPEAHSESHGTERTDRTGRDTEILFSDDQSVVTSPVRGRQTDRQSAVLTENQH